MYKDLARQLKNVFAVGIRRMNQDHPNYSIFKISMLAVTQTPVKDHQIMLVKKTRKDYHENNHSDASEKSTK